MGSRASSGFVLFALHSFAGRAAADGGPAEAGERAEALPLPTTLRECPAAEEVWQAALRLMPPNGSAASADARPTLLLSDRGKSYVVTVVGRSHEYEDERHNCADRTQAAAVFVALTLAPPAGPGGPPAPLPNGDAAVGASPPLRPAGPRGGHSERPAVASAPRNHSASAAPAVTPESVEASPVPTTNPPSPVSQGAAALPATPSQGALDPVAKSAHEVVLARRSAEEKSPPGAASQRPYRLEVGIVGTATRVGVDRTAASAGVRLQGGRVFGRWEGVVGASLLSPAFLEYGERQVQLRRIPLHAGARWSIQPGERVRASVQGGVLVEISRWQAENLPDRGAVTRLGVGLRSEVELAFQLGRLYPYLSLHTEYLPMRHTLHLRPSESIGEAPNLWLGAAAGVGVTF